MSGLVVDTSVWIEFFAGRSLPALEEALRAGNIVLSPIVFAEILSGRNIEAHEKKLLDFLDDLDLHPTPRSHWRAVGKLRQRCREQRLRLSTPDAHIAQCALDLNVPLYSFDDVFLKLARHVPLKLLQEK